MNVEALFLLLFPQEVQQKAYDELADILEQSDGKINQESVKDMNYIEAVINETLRMYSVVTNFTRVCMKDCEVDFMARLII